MNPVYTLEWALYIYWGSSNTGSEWNDGYFIDCNHTAICQCAWRAQRLLLNSWDWGVDLSSLLFINLTAAAICGADHCLQLFMLRVCWRLTGAGGEMYVISWTTLKMEEGNKKRAKHSLSSALNWQTHTDNEGRRSLTLTCSYCTVKSSGLNNHHR